MFLGDIIVKYLLLVFIARMIIWEPWLQSLMASIMTMALMLFLGTVIEGIRAIIPKRKQRTTELSSDKKSPFWFEVIESAFAFWMLYSIATLMATYYNYRLRY